MHTTSNSVFIVRECSTLYGSLGWENPADMLTKILNLSDIRRHRDAFVY